VRITKYINIAVDFTPARISMLGHTGEAWDHWLYFGRALVRHQRELRAWQLHILWFNFSLWHTNCKPLIHGMHATDYKLSEVEQ
jgi:hypothetical protein